MNYKQAIKDASYFRVEIDIDGQPAITTRKASREWLNEANRWLKSSEKVTACRVAAVLPDGKEVDVGGWTQTESKLTDDQRIEGRTAFADDLTINQVVGGR